jgi:hypothetical protein
MADDDQRESRSDESIGEAFDDKKEEDDYYYYFLLLYL